jgi:hypothetical protein
MPYSITISDLHVFQQYLVGNWSNDGVPRECVNGHELPYSYNVMPLPQQAVQPGSTLPYHGYILKNFRYIENITFHPRTPPFPTIAPPAAAPNRGFKFRQVPHALFYDQVVNFAEGPDVDNIVHVENGAWLHLQNQQPVIGPYSGISSVDTADPTDLDFAKQISVPHGNSILALGRYTGQVTGTPNIDASSALPTQVDPTRYRTLLDSRADFENPNVAYSEDPSRPIRTLVNLLNVTNFHHIVFSTRLNKLGQHGFVTNIPFEDKMASAVEYEADYWLLDVENSGTYPYLAYTQNITLRLAIDGLDYEFPHITTNVVKRQTEAMAVTSAP